MPLSTHCGSIDPMRTLLDELESLGSGITAPALIEVLGRSRLDIEDVAPFVTEQAETYSRRSIARTEFYEVLVLTWLPGQGSGAHDHAGSMSAFKILRGTARETRFEQACDSLVDPISVRDLREGEVGLDATDVIHAVRNDASSKEALVSVHIYAPPIAELRSFTQRLAHQAPAAAFLRRRKPDIPVVAIVGGGYSGAMVAAHLLQETAHSDQPLHVVMIDRQTSVAEGAAYRTPDPRHLLNVPASGMSTWPDRPNDFLNWARVRDPSVLPYSFLQRHAYGEYLRATFFEAVEQAGAMSSIDILREEADRVERVDGGWRVHCGESPAIEAHVVVLATGHRPPLDPLRQRWSGSRVRYIEDPWSSLALTAIEPDESVCLLGTGLTAIDVLQSLLRRGRSAAVVGLSRRGLLPSAHAPAELPRIDPLSWLEPLLRPDSGVTTRSITQEIHRAVRAAEASGKDWRQVIDGLRPHLSRIWRALQPREQKRFMRHAKPFWEVARHRMAPVVANETAEAVAAGIFSTAAARVLAARGSAQGVALTVRRRGEPTPEVLEFDWIVNCTGPGAGHGTGCSPLISGLIDAGCLEADPLGLGVRSHADGRAVVRGRVIEDLILIGSLRKADEWESTAVPELCVQAADAAHAVLRRIDDLEQTRLVAG